MDLIKPTTDNLYKFLATGGLALLVAGIVLWFQENDRLNAAKYQAFTERANANVDVEIWAGRQRAAELQAASSTDRGKLFFERFSKTIENVGLPKDEHDKIVDDVQAMVDKGKVFGRQ